MADETKPGEGQPQQAPIDMAALSATVANGVRAAISDIAKDIPAGRPAQPAQPAAPRPANPIADAVMPALEPILAPIAQNLDLQARASYDATMFYSNPTNKDAFGYQAEIERRFAQAPRPRAAIWNELKGEKFDEFYKARLSEQQEAEKRASLALTVGSGAPRGFMDGPAKPFDEMTDEELQQSLQTAQF